MAKKNPIPNSTPFKPGKSGNPKGRPKRTVSATLSAMKAKGYEEMNAEQVRAVMQRMLNLSRDELAEIGTDKKAPILDALIARALIGGKGWEALQDILDRAHGKAKQQVDLTSGGEKMPSPIIQMLPPDE